jgi:hypothetical protein
MDSAWGLRSARRSQQHRHDIEIDIDIGSARGSRSAGATGSSNNLPLSALTAHGGLGAREEKS